MKAASQRGFISSIYLYAILAVLFAGLGYGLYYQIQRNGKLEAENKQWESNYKWLAEQNERNNKAQTLAQRLKDQAERDAARTHQQLSKLREQHAELLSLVIADGLVVGLFNAIAEANGDLPTGQPDGKDKTTIPKITLGSLYEWATEAVPEAIKKCNADKLAIRAMCEN